jgi:hypothetical protein
VRTRLVAAALALALTYPALPARADGFNSLFAGINGLLTFPADPIVDVIEVSEDLQDLPLREVTGRVIGVFLGSGVGLYRATFAAADVLLFPLWVVPTLSPEAKFEIIPFYEVDYDGGGFADIFVSEATRSSSVPIQASTRSSSSAPADAG